MIGPGVYSTPTSAFSQTSLRGGPLYKPYMGKNVKDYLYEMYYPNELDIFTGREMFFEKMLV